MFTWPEDIQLAERAIGTIVQSNQIIGSVIKSGAALLDPALLKDV